MPQSNDAANAGEKSETTAPTEVQTTSSVSQVEPTTETQTASSVSSSILDKMGISTEVQAELKATQGSKEEPEPANDLAQADVPQEPQQQPENEAQTQEHDESSADTGDEPLPKPNKDWPPEVQAEFTKRVGKEARKRRKERERAEQAEELADTLRAQLENTQPVTVAPSSNDLFADIQNEQQLAQRVGEWRLVRDWCRQHQQGYVANEGKENEEVITPEEVANRLSRAEDALMFEAPKKAAQLQERHKYDATARQVYAPLFDRGTEDYQIGNALVLQLPGLANHPAKNLIIGDYLEGVKARIARTKGNSSTAAVRPEVQKILEPKQPIAPHVPAAQRSNGATPSTKKVEQAMNQVAQDGSHESLVAALAARRKARESKGAPRELVAA